MGLGLPVAVLGMRSAPGGKAGSSLLDGPGEKLSRPHPFANGLFH